MKPNEAKFVTALELLEDADFKKMEEQIDSCAVEMFNSITNGGYVYVYNKVKGMMADFLDIRVI